MVARRAHNPEVAGSSPASATKNTGRPLVGRPVFLTVKFMGLEPSFAARAVKLLAFAHPMKPPSPLRLGKCRSTCPASATKNTGRPLVGRPVFLSAKFMGLEPSFTARAVKLLAFAHPMKPPSPLRRGKCRSTCPASETERADTSTRGVRSFRCEAQVSVCPERRLFSLRDPLAFILRT